MKMRQKRTSKGPEEERGLTHAEVFEGALSKAKPHPTTKARGHETSTELAKKISGAIKAAKKGKRFILPWRLHPIPKDLDWRRREQHSCGCGCGCKVNKTGGGE